MKLQIHHIEICVSDPERTLQILRGQFGFEVVGTRDTVQCNQTVVQAGKKIFVVTFRKNSQDLQSEEPWTIFCCNDNESAKKGKDHIDSVFNIAIEVENLSNVLQHLNKIGCQLIRGLTTVSGPDGSAKYAILKSCCGNIVHTLIEKSNYHGKFLPEFDDCRRNQVNGYGSDSHFGLTSHFDHVSVACRVGETDDLINWYSRAFAMRRFMTNREESEENGLVIGGEVGMRLKVMEFWMCSEIGIVSFSECNSKFNWEPMKIVVVESLPDTSNTQIDIFIRDHQGPGVQHIGLYSPNIFETVEKMTSNGVKFRRPPEEYYTQIGQLNAIVDVGANLDKLKKCGILLDSEVDASDNAVNEKYLMQIFTFPIFKRETFFLEVIERKGALGFGIGNVTALARSINAYNLSKCKVTQ